MANPRTLTVEYLKTNCPEGHELEIQVYHTKGGVSYWNYKQYPAGNCVQVKKVKRSTSGTGLGCISFGMGDGIAAPLDEVSRFNYKKLQGYAATIKDNEVYKKVLEAVLTKFNLELVAEEKEAEAA